MKDVKNKGKKYKKSCSFYDDEYVNSRLIEFVDAQKKHDWTWRDFSDFFGQSAIGTIRNWYLDGVPKNQLFFVHLVLEKAKY